MDEDPEPGKLPAAADEALERLLSREDRISDLIAFLAALDPEPFLAALGLPIRQARVRREARLGGQAGNADLVVSDEAGPVALLEIKASAAQHGDQFERYDAWARARTPPARCYLIALDGESLGAPGGWVTEPSLPRLVRSWQHSSNPHAAWLASAAAGIFEGWTTQADGKLGSATGSIVGDLVARRMASALLGASSHPGILTRATRQSGGGAAMVLAWLPWPGQPPHPRRLAVRRLPVHCPGPPRGTVDAAPGSRSRNQRPGPGRPGKGHRARPGRDDPRHAHLHSGAAGAPAGGRGGPGGLPPPPKGNTRRAPQGAGRAGARRVAGERRPARCSFPAPGPVP